MSDAGIAWRPASRITIWSPIPCQTESAISDGIASTGSRSQSRGDMTSAGLFLAFAPVVARYHGASLASLAVYYPLYTKCCELDLPLCMNTGIPGPPIGPAPCSTSTESAVTSRSGSSMRAAMSL